MAHRQPYSSVSSGIQTIPGWIVSEGFNQATKVYPNEFLFALLLDFRITMYLNLFMYDIVIFSPFLWHSKPVLWLLSAAPKRVGGTRGHAGSKGLPHWLSNFEAEEHWRIFALLLG